MKVNVFCNSPSIQIDFLDPGLLRHDTNLCKHALSII